MKFEKQSTESKAPDTPVQAQKRPFLSNPTQIPLTPPTEPHSKRSGQSGGMFGGSAECVTLDIVTETDGARVHP